MNFNFALLQTMLASTITFHAIADDIPIIDAHSQLSTPNEASQVISLMNTAGVSRMILSYRQAKLTHVLDIATQNPGRIIPAVKTKGNDWPKGNSKSFEQISAQLAEDQVGAMGEVLIYHAAKGSKAPEWRVRASDKQVQFVLNACRTRGWPMIVHYEFRSDTNSERSMEELEALLRDNRDINMPLIHMAQLDADQVGRLIDAHPNVFFMVSHSNPITMKSTKQPWTNLFKDRELKKEWRDLIVSHPDRFILNFDNVFPEHWSENYFVAQAKLWKEILATLPHEAAHALAHKNAERLWNLPPLRYGVHPVIVNRVQTNF